MWISKSRFQELEKRIAALEAIAHEQQVFNESIHLNESIHKVVIERINEETRKGNPSPLVI